MRPYLIYEYWTDLNHIAGISPISFNEALSEDRWYVSPRIYLVMKGVESLLRVEIGPDIEVAFDRIDDPVPYPTSEMAAARKVYDDLVAAWKDNGQRAVNGEIAVLRAALDDIHMTAHCISKSGPATTPTLADAWRKFDQIAVKATNALWATRQKKEQEL